VNAADGSISFAFRTLLVDAARRKMLGPRSSAARGFLPPVLRSPMPCRRPAHRRDRAHRSSVATDWPHPQRQLCMPNDVRPVDLVPLFAPDPGAGACQPKILVTQFRRLLRFDDYNDEVFSFYVQRSTRRRFYPIKTGLVITALPRFRWLAGCVARAACQARLSCQDRLPVLWRARREPVRLEGDWATLASVKAGRKMMPTRRKTARAPRSSLRFAATIR